MASHPVSAVLFAKSVRRVAPFYREVLGASIVDRGEHHESLECGGLHHLIQQIPDMPAHAHRAEEEMFLILSIAHQIVNVDVPAGRGLHKMFRSDSTVEYYDRESNG